MKNKETLVFMIVALVIGILVGVIAVNLMGRKEQRAPMGPPPGTSGSMVNVQQNIQVLEDLVAKDPGNRNAWVELGNTYFDSDMPMKAVEAYGKALELNGKDPNVLTDQGIMFRQLGWYDRAIENFRKANEIDPRHSPSLFNLGLVYRENLNDDPHAIEAWEKFLALNPTGQSADYVRNQLELLRSHPPAPKAQ